MYIVAEIAKKANNKIQGSVKTGLYGWNVRPRENQEFAMMQKIKHDYA